MDPAAVVVDCVGASHTSVAHGPPDVVCNMPSNASSTPLKFVDVADADVLSRKIEVGSRSVTLALDRAASFPATLLALDRKQVRQIKTNENGACALHALFGAPNAGGELQLANA